MPTRGRFLRAEHVDGGDQDAVIPPVGAADGCQHHEEGRSPLVAFRLNFSLEPLERIHFFALELVKIPTIFNTKFL